MNHPNSFPKSEHLCGEIRINSLFTQGKAFIAYPLRVVYLFTEKKDSEPTNILISVPKKRFKKAVDRNRLKRLIREAYRLNKHDIISKLNEKQLQIQIAFNYVSDDLLDFETIEKKMKVALHKLHEKIEQFENQSIS
jgi:ribonuclease P protein component